ncbi:MAG: FAD-dependent monooxygenase [Rhodospirillales bacterium]
MTNKTQIIIAGAGPVGCVVGLILARAGISVTILETENDLIPELRASTFHPPTLDMLDDLGVTPKLIDQGLITPKIQYRDLEDGLVAEFDHALIDDRTKHPYRLQCEQFKLTRIIAEMLKEFPHAEISFDSKFVDASQTDNAVRVFYETPAGSEQVTCDYLIGADGSRSEVRKSQKIEFQGFTYPEQFVTVSVPEDVGKIVPGMGHVCYIAHPTQWCALIHAPDYWRFLFPIPMETTKEEAFDDDFLEGRLQHLAPHQERYAIQLRTLYGVNQRVAETYRLGRILLAGDSAHVNNPLGGMGMNGGIHDGVNLADKLVRMYEGGETEELLNLYDRQRRPIAIEYVQAQTMRNKKNLEETDPNVRRQRQDELRDVAKNVEKSRVLLLQTSMINGLERSEAIT